MHKAGFLPEFDMGAKRSSDFAQVTTQKSLSF